jgi:hypothetical protein
MLRGLLPVPALWTVRATHAAECAEGAQGCLAKSTCGWESQVLPRVCWPFVHDRIQALTVRLSAAAGYLR